MKALRRTTNAHMGHTPDLQLTGRGWRRIKRAWKRATPEQRKAFAPSDELIRMTRADAQAMVRRRFEAEQRARMAPRPKKRMGHSFFHAMKMMALMAVGRRPRRPGRALGGLLLASFLLLGCVAPPDMTKAQKLEQVRVAASVAVRELSPADRDLVCRQIQLYREGFGSLALLEGIPAGVQVAVDLAVAYAAADEDLAPWVEAVVAGLSGVCP